MISNNTDHKIYPYKYRGFVVNNQDPKKIGRVQCRVPAILGDKIFTDWATPANNIFFGSVFIPNIGDKVWVEFEEGDLDRPLYTCAWYASPSSVSELPNLSLGIPDNSATKEQDSFITADGLTKREPIEPFKAVYPNNRVIKTKAGHIIELDDTPGSFRIKIYHPSGTMEEYHPSGEKVERVTNGRYSVITIGDDLHINGNWDVKVDNNATLNVEQNYIFKSNNKIENILSNNSLNVVGNNSTSVQVDNNLLVNGIDTLEVNGSRTKIINGAEIIENNGAKTETVVGAKTETVVGAKTETVVGAKTEIIAGLLNMILSGGLTIETIGTLNIIADDINIEARNNLNRKAGNKISDEADSIEHI